MLLQDTIEVPRIELRQLVKRLSEVSTRMEAAIWARRDLPLPVVKELVVLLDEVLTSKRKDGLLDIVCTDEESEEMFVDLLPIQQGIPTQTEEEVCL